MQKQNIEENFVRLKEIGCNNKLIATTLGISEFEVTVMSQNLHFVVHIEPKRIKTEERFLRQNALIRYYAQWLYQAGWSEAPIEIKAIRLEIEEAKIIEKLCTFVQILFTVRKSQLFDSRRKQRTILFSKVLFNPERMDLADDLLQYKLPQSVRGKDPSDSEIFGAAQAVFMDYIIPQLAREKDVDHSLSLLKRVDKWCGRRLHQLTTTMIDLPPEENLYKFLQEVLDEKLMWFLSMRVGFFGASPKNLAKIAEILGLDQAGVREFEKSALDQIAQKLTQVFPNVGLHINDAQVESMYQSDDMPILESLMKVGLSEKASIILVDSVGVTSVAAVLCLSDKEVDSIKNIEEKTALEIKNYRHAQLELATQ